MSKTIENPVHYEYRCFDGKTVLQFRTLSANERRRLFFESKRWSWIIRGLQKAQQEFDLDLWDRQFSKLAEVIQAIGIGKTYKQFVKMRENVDEVMGVITRFMQVEMALNDGEDVPEQENLIPTEEEVDEATPPELEKMGEESPAEDHTQTM